MEKNKVRPVLIISNNILNNKSDDCIVVPLTTVIKNESYSIIITSEDLESGKLLKSSRIRLDKIFSIKKSLTIMKIGIIKQEVFQAIKKEFYNLI
jgi:mRNA-degrading endonuclease toxin of MazEF toxin-antitoxin module